MSDVALRVVMSAVGGAGITSMVGQVASAFNGKNGLTNGLKAVGLAAAAMGVTTAIALGVQAVKAAGTFQSGITSLSTGAGELQSNLGMVSDGILSLAVSTGTSTKQLTDGMFMIESAGYHGAAGLAVLKTAAQGAKVGNADLGTTADAVTTIMKDYGIKATNSADAMNFLTAIVSNGKTRMQDLAGSMAAILPTSSAVGVSLNDVGGAMATMTGEGVPAANAATYLRQMLISLSSPAAAGAKSLAAIGLTSQQVSNDMKKSLPDTLNLIMTHLGETYKVGSPQYVTALKNISGGSRQMQGMLDLTGAHLKAFGANVASVGATVNKGKGNIVGWSQVQGNFNQKMSQAKEMLETTSIKIGTALLPAVTKLISGLMTLGTWIGNVANFFAKNQVAMDALKAVLLAVGVVILTTVVPAFILWAISMAPVVVEALLLAAPFVLATIIIAAVIFGVIEVIQHWGQIVAWLKGVWSDIVGFFQNIWNGVLLGLRIVGQWFANVWSGITTGVGNFFSGLGSIVQKGLQLVLDYFELPFRIIGFLFNWLYQHNTYFQKLVDKIREIVSIGVAFLKRAWTNIINEIVGLWQKLSGFATTAWNNVVKAIQIAWALVVGVVTSVWQKISSVFTNAWTNYISKPVASLWSNVTGAFGNAWSTISQKLSSLWSSISGWFGNLATQAIQWGANLISGFLKGVQNALSSVGKTLGNVGSSIASYLGFHSPTKEGPGREADQWAPNLMKMYAQGLQAGIPQLQASLNMVMRPVVGTLGAIPTTSVARPMAPAPVASGHTFNLYISTMAGSPSEIRRFANLIQQELGRQFRSQSPGYSAGGLY